MAEGARLESVYTLTGIVGSNPTLSAITFLKRNELWGGLTSTSVQFTQLPALPPDRGLAALSPSSHRHMYSGSSE